MNNQDVIKICNAISECIEKDNVVMPVKESDGNEIIKGMKVAISALEKRLNNGWIPCSERLPILRQHEYGEPIEYNIMVNGGTVATTGCINQEGIWGWMDWNSFKFNVIGAHVIAWQPLPEKYTEVSK